MPRFKKINKTPDPVILSKEEYFRQASELFSFIAEEHAKAWQTGTLREDEYPEESVCNKCTGCGIYREGIGQCHQDKEMGECYVRYFDAGQFGEEVAAKIGDIGDLLITDKLT